MSEPNSRRSSPFAPVRPAWLAQRREEILDPEVAIIDAHHHLWDRAVRPSSPQWRLPKRFGCQAHRMVFVRESLPSSICGKTAL
jgi:hypothetical protein